MFIKIIRYLLIFVIMSKTTNVRSNVFVVVDDTMLTIKIVTSRNITIYNNEFTRVKLKIITKQFFEL